MGQFEVIEVSSHSPETREFVMQGDFQAKVIGPNNDHGHVYPDNVAVIQSGLPGVEWRTDMERKFTDYIGEGRNVGAIFMVPPGIKHTPESFNLADPNDLRMLEPNEQQFSLQGYLDNLNNLILCVREGVKDNLKGFHVIGHSYGAVSVLHSLNRMKNEGLVPPSSCTFAAPFVKNSLDDECPELALSIKRTWGDIGNLVLGHPNVQKEILRGVLEGVRDCYEVDEGVDLLEMHRATFNAAFFGAIRADGSLRDYTDSVKLQAMRGVYDKYIADDQILALKYLLSGQRFDLTRFPRNDHELKSLQPEDLFRDI